MFGSSANANKIRELKELLARKRRDNVENSENYHNSDFSSTSNPTDIQLEASLTAASSSYDRCVKSTNSYNKSNCCSNTNSCSSTFRHGSLEYCQSESSVNVSKCEGGQNYFESVSSSFQDDDQDDDDLSDSSSANENVKKVRTSEESLRINALQRPIFNIFKDFHCSSTCKFGRCCKQTITMVAILEELKSFWGDTSIALRTNQRRKKVISKLFSAYQRDVKTLASDGSSFAFSIGTTIGQQLRVCENTYLHVIGHAKTPMWLRLKTAVQDLMNSGDYANLDSKSGFDDEVMKMIKQTKDPSEKKSRNQTESCIEFIEWFGKNNGSFSPNEGEENLVILPLETLSQLYTEYCFQCEKESRTTACKETFRVAYLQLKKGGKYKFARGKGTFPTCDICNNANDLLASSRSTKMSPQVREMIMKLKVRYL